MCDMPRCSRPSGLRYNVPMLFRGKQTARKKEICWVCWDRHCLPSNHPKHKNIKQALSNLEVL